MNREWAASLHLRNNRKQHPVMSLSFREGEIIGTSDRRYEVLNGGWRLIEWLSEPNLEAPIFRETKHVSKPYVAKYPAIVPESVSLLKGKEPNAM